MALRKAGHSSGLKLMRSLLFWFDSVHWVTITYSPAASSSVRSPLAGDDMELRDVEVRGDRIAGRLGGVDHPGHAGPRMRASSDEVEPGNVGIAIVRPEVGALRECRRHGEGRALIGAESGGEIGGVDDSSAARGVGKMGASVETPTSDIRSIVTDLYPFSAHCLTPAAHTSGIADVPFNTSIRHFACK